MGDGANFSWQHHARWVTKNETYATMTWAPVLIIHCVPNLTWMASVFDNAGEYGESDESSSRGLYLALNFTKMSVELIQEVIPHNYTISQSQGSMQLQPNGNFLTGCVQCWCSVTMADWKLADGDMSLGGLNTRRQESLSGLRSLV